MNTNQVCEKTPTSNYPKEASTSENSDNDQEMGMYSNSIIGDVLKEAKPLFCFASQEDLTKNARMVLAEMLGTFILMFCVCGIIASTQLMRGEVGLLEYAATGGLTVVVLIYSIGPISGAHVNPAVTIAFAVLGQISWSKAPFYILAQILGSLFATYVGASVYGIEAELVITQPLNGWPTAFWAELISSFIIMFLAASMSFHAHILGHLAGFVVGIAISLTILVTGPVSGGSLNPARSLGPAVVSWRFDYIWLYIIAPTGGAVAGGFVARVLRIECKPCSSSPNGGCN